MTRNTDVRANLPRILPMKRLRSLCAVLLLALAAPIAFAQTQPAPASTPALQPGHEVTADGRHTLNLKDADIQALIATVSEITGKNFIVGPNVQGRVTVVSAKPMRPDEIYDVFLSVLHVHGFAAVPSGSMVKILPEALAQTEATTAAVARTPDELVTQIVPVKHVSAAELVPILRPLMPQGGQIIAHASSNSLIISDRAANVQRLAGIIQRIDTSADAEVEVIPLTHANAAEIARTLTLLADDKGAPPGESPRVFADTRTNSVLSETVGCGQRMPVAWPEPTPITMSATVTSRPPCAQPIGLPWRGSSGRPMRMRSPSALYQSGPISPTNSPRFNSMSMPSSACKPPKRMPMSSRRSNTSLRLSVNTVRASPSPARLRNVGFGRKRSTAGQRPCGHFSSITTRMTP